MYVSVYDCVSYIPLHICIHIASWLLFVRNRIVVGHSEVLRNRLLYVGGDHVAMEQSSSWNYVISI